MITWNLLNKPRTSRGDQMSGATASHSGRLGNPKIAGSSSELFYPFPPQSYHPPFPVTHPHFRSAHPHPHPPQNPSPTKLNEPPWSENQNQKASTKRKHQYQPLLRHPVPPSRRTKCFLFIFYQEKVKETLSGSFSPSRPDLLCITLLTFLLKKDTETVLTLSYFFSQK